LFFGIFSRLGVSSRRASTSRVNRDVLQVGIWRWALRLSEVRRASTATTPQSGWSEMRQPELPGTRRSRLEQLNPNH